MKKASLFERLGGEFAINAAVEKLYEKIMSDGDLSPFFQNIVINNQIEKMKTFLKHSFGEQYEGLNERLRVAHRPYVKKGLSDKHYDAVVMHIKGTLEELGVDSHLVQEVKEQIEVYRDDVLCRGEA